MVVNLSVKNVRNSINHAQHVSCEFEWDNPNFDVLIFDHDAKINRDIIIRERNTIEVRKDLCLADNAKIIVERNAKLVINGEGFIRVGANGKVLLLKVMRNPDHN